MSPSHHIRTHVVGYVAVFLALTGSAHALTGTNTVDSGDIVDSGVTRPDIGKNAVTSVNLADDTLASADLLDRGVNPVDLKANAVNGAKVLDGSLGRDEFTVQVQPRVPACSSSGWRYFQLSENFFSCASPIFRARASGQTNLPGWEVVNGCHTAGYPILGIESTQNFASVNWLYSDGVELHQGGTALSKSQSISFSDGPIWGLFILSNPGNGSSVPANAITLTFAGATCPAKGTAAVGLL